MSKSDYGLLFPKADATCQSYCKRLEDDGHAELFIRKALRVHWSMALSEFGAFFEDFPEARMREVAALYEKKHPNRTDHSFALSLSKNLGISQSQASDWIGRFHKRGNAGHHCDS
ncbi:hypothetical protein [Labrenzia sp. VG12]|uniref:hypothetical protein n=1 Tax=Labrenzia sp. VG12 TaxID=2021862 RepID=UPI000B8C45E1|nr:hypothetical protein [Labrenzia sp. VG12]ASP33142.1 hypothetical protein CHH27_07695 [Labrenzia sp. VG12]